MIRPTPDIFVTERLTSFDQSWIKKRLPNGMTAIHVPLKNDDRFYLGMMIRSGTRLESIEKSGISHFLEHMMFRGSKLYPDFTKLAEAFEWLGGDWNAATSFEQTEYTYTGIRHTAKDVIKLFADFLENPLLLDIEIERQVILRELDGETNDHGHSTDLQHHLSCLMYPGSSLSLPILGSRDSIASIEVSDLIAWRKQWYTPPNMVVCSIGSDPEIPQAIDEFFGPLWLSQNGHPVTSFPEFSRFKGPAVKWVEHSDNEYEISLGFLCQGEWSSEALIYELIARILSDGFCSRLNRRLREELGLVYAIDCHAQLSLESGMIVINASCAQDDFDGFLRELFTLLQSFVETGPSEDELRRTILRSVIEVELSPINLDFIASRLSWETLCGKQRSLLDEKNRLIALTQADLISVIKQVFQPVNLAMVALGPHAKDLEKRMRKAIAL